MKKIISFFVLFLTFCNFLLFSSQSIENAGFPGEHLITYSASALNTAIGKAGSALEGASYLSYWNPAGIYKVERPEVHILNSELFTGTKWQYFSFARRLYKKFYTGISYFGLSTGDIETTDSFGNVLGYIRERRYGYIFGFSLPANPFIVLGLNIKIVYHSIGEYSDSGYGFDLGANFKLPFKNIRAGFVWQNIMPPRLKLLNDFEKYPHTLRTGFDIPFISEKADFLFDVALIDVFSSDRVFRYYSGIKYRLFDILSLGAGYEKRGISFGFSLDVKDVSLDYGVTFEDIDTVHHFDLVFKLGLTPEESKLLSAERKKKKIKQITEEMEYYFSQGVFSKAKQKANEIIKIDKENQRANKILSVCTKLMCEKEADFKFQEAEKYFKEGKVAAASELLSQAEKLSPGIKKKKEKEYYNLAEKALFNNEYDKCDEYLLKVIWLNSDNKDALDMLKRVKKIKEMMK